MNKGIIYGKNIYLRDIKIEDIDNGWLEWINDSQSNRYLSTKGPVTRENLVQYIENSRPPNAYMFAVCLNENDKYIGNGRISSVDWINKKASYGRLIGVSDTRGSGIGTELLVLLAYYAFYHLNLNKITTGVVQKNIASIRSNEKAGALQEGVIKSSEFVDGEYEDVVSFGLTRELFDKTNWKDLVVYNKLALGAVQFGMQYGISNVLGKVQFDKVKLILEEAYNKSIRFIDTAPLYGDSESVIGNLTENSEWNIITKIPKVQGSVIDNASIFNIKSTFESSLINLRRPSIYGLLAHSCDDLFKVGGMSMYKFMRDLKDQKKVKKIGVSVYSFKQIHTVLKNFDIDLIQVPINIFDQRLLKSGVLEELKDRGIEIHARSIFLQGLLLANTHDLPKYFRPFNDRFDKFEDIAKSLSMTKLGLSLAFVNSIPQIDRIIFGIDSLNHLHQILYESNKYVDISDFTNLAVNDERLLNPGLWNL
jgi:aryl-alcohol dehydrogenase-like predicted oxidoreductase/RimJ/RimL family protein N-acetyltransferase